MNEAVWRTFNVQITQSQLFCWLSQWDIYYIPVPVTVDQIMSFHGAASTYILSHYISYWDLCALLIWCHKVTTEGCGAYLILLCLPWALLPTPRAEPGWDKGPVPKVESYKCLRLNRLNCLLKQIIIKTYIYQGKKESCIYTEISTF